MHTEKESFFLHAWYYFQSASSLETALRRARAGRERYGAMQLSRPPPQRQRRLYGERAVRSSRLPVKQGGKRGAEAGLHHSHWTGCLPFHAIFTLPFSYFRHFMMSSNVPHAMSTWAISLETAFRWGWVRKKVSYRPYIVAEFSQSPFSWWEAAAMSFSIISMRPFLFFEHSFDISPDDLLQERCRWRWRQVCGSPIYHVTTEILYRYFTSIVDLISISISYSHMIWYASAFIMMFPPARSPTMRSYAEEMCRQRGSITLRWLLLRISILKRGFHFLLRRASHAEAFLIRGCHFFFLHL